MLILIAFVVLFTSSSEASAQRTMKGQYHIGAHSVIATDSRFAAGGEISFGSYLLDSYIIGWVNITPDHIKLSSSHLLGYVPVAVGADYMHRVAATRSRSVNLYVGGGVFLGYEFYDPSSRVPSYINTNLGSGAFIYGAAPSIVSELFITKMIAITLGVRMPVSVSSKAEILKAHFKTGIRINI